MERAASGMITRWLDQRILLRSFPKKIGPGSENRAADQVKLRLADLILVGHLLDRRRRPQRDHEASPEPCLVGFVAVETGLGDTLAGWIKIAFRPHVSRQEALDADAGEVVTNETTDRELTLLLVSKPPLAAADMPLTSHEPKATRPTSHLPSVLVAVRSRLT